MGWDRRGYVGCRCLCNVHTYLLTYSLLTPPPKASRLGHTHTVQLAQPPRCRFLSSSSQPLIFPRLPLPCLRYAGIRRGWCQPESPHLIPFHTYILYLHTSIRTRHLTRTCVPVSSSSTRICPAGRPLRALLIRPSSIIIPIYLLHPSIPSITSPIPVAIHAAPPQLPRFLDTKEVVVVVEVEVVVGVLC